MADTLTGKSYDVTGSLAAALTAGGSETITLVNISVQNNHTAAVDLDIFINRTSGDDGYVVKAFSIPQGDTLELDGKYILNSNDALQMMGSVANKLDATLSYLVQT
jgi:hypothetical protein